MLKILHEVEDRISQQNKLLGFKGYPLPTFA